MAAKKGTVSAAVGLSSLRTALKAAQKKDRDIIPRRNIDWIPSGSPTWDLMASGQIGKGLPRGRLIEVFGNEHSGKSSMCLLFCASVLKQGLVVVYIDFEGVFDFDYARDTFGIDVNDENFIVLTPKSIDSFDLVKDEIEAIVNLGLLIWDSIAASKTEKEIEGLVCEDAKMKGQHAKAMGRVTNFLRHMASRQNSVVVYTNQIRQGFMQGMEQAVGVGAGFNTQDSSYTTGGNAPRFYASIRVKLEFGGRLTEEGTNAPGQEGSKIRVGQNVKVINVKNKCATPFIATKAFFIFPSKHRNSKGGWSAGEEILNILTAMGYVKVAGTKMIYKGLSVEWSNIGKKVDSVRKFIEDKAVMEDAVLLINKTGLAWDTKEGMLAAEDEDDELNEAVDTGSKGGKKKPMSLEISLDDDDDTVV